VLLVGASFGLVASAHATEPQDNTMYGARGPLESSVETTGSLTVGGTDSDYYYFYVSANSTVTVDFVAGNSSQMSYGFGYSAGVDSRYDGGYSFNSMEDDPVAGSWSVTRTLYSGLHFIRVFDAAPGLDPAAYSLTVTGSNVATSAPPNGIRPLGLRNVDGGSGSSNAVMIKPSYDHIGWVKTDHSDWYKFYVTKTSDVYMGWTGGATLGGNLYDAKLKKLGAFGATSPKHLSAGKYYVKWYLAPGMHSGLYRFAVMGAYVSDHPFATLSVPTLSTTSPKHGKTFKVAGFLSPAHEASTTVTATKLMFYRYEHGHYAYKMYRYAAISDYSSSKSRYSKSLSLSAGKWYVKARHGDSNHLVSYSGKRYFTVR